MPRVSGHADKMESVDLSFNARDTNLRGGIRRGALDHIIAAWPGSDFTKAWALTDGGDPQQVWIHCFADLLKLHIFSPHVLGWVVKIFGLDLQHMR